MKIAALLFEIVTLLGCALGGLTMLDAFHPGISAVHQAAIAAMAIALGAIPYMAAGVFHRMSMRAILEKQVTE